MTPVIDDTIRQLAATLKGLPCEQDREPPPGLNLPGHTIQQKLVSSEIIEAHLSIAYDDHLRGQIIVDYFVHVLAGEFKLLDNLRYLVEEARKTNPRPMMTLPLLLVECGLRLRELPADQLDPVQVQRRFESRDAVASPASSEPYYLAIASHLASQISPPRRGLLGQTRSRQQIKALLFTDAVLTLPGPTAPPSLAGGDFLASSIQTAGVLRDLATPELLQQHLIPFLRGKP